MPDKLDEILSEIRELKSWLYGKDGFEGDIPAIKEEIKDHNKRIRRIEIILAATGIIGGSAVGIIKALSG